MAMVADLQRIGHCGHEVIPIRVPIYDAQVSRESMSIRSGKLMQTVWVEPGQSVSVLGVELPGGMLYVGSTLTSWDGNSEPAQIDPSLRVDTQAASPAERLFGHWPRYGDISVTARRAYLTWLAEGRTDPTADIGFVFLFFYGLERRMLVDAATDPVARAEMPAIVDEIERLRSIYDDGSFLRHSADLLDFLAAGDVKAKQPDGAPPPATGNRGMTMRLRVGLGQAAGAAQPVAADWALAWVRSEPSIRLTSVARRCARQFDAQFMRCYAEKFGMGLQLPLNRTKLKISYRPASGGLLNQSFVANLGDLPDVTTVVTPLKKLQAVVDEVTTTLDAYSRLIGKHPEKVASLEATLLLPKPLWSSGVASAFDALDQRVGTGMVVIKLGELLDALGGAPSLTRATLKNLFTVLENAHVGVEPDVLAGARVPKSDDSIVLFRLQSRDTLPGDGRQGSYDAVAVMLDLAITLANADGRISGREVQFLNRQVDAWSHVGAAAQRRLRARLRLHIVYPPSLASLRSRIEPLPMTARTGLARLLSALALADGRLEPAAVRHLEKVYQLLGIDSTSLYGELHVVSAAKETRPPANVEQTGRVPAPQNGVDAPDDAPKTGGEESGLRLDASRIAALQAESERVTSLLAKVFDEQEPQPPAIVSLPMTDDDTGYNGSRLLGLDPEHSAFLRALLTRARWSRAELLDMAADMELMLDGALERVNEAALDRFDSAVAEGEDPIEIAQDLMESVST
jgi:uncharacterized tellurite resistance protein B-like protein